MREKTVASCHGPHGLSFCRTQALPSVSTVLASCRRLEVTNHIWIVKLLGFTLNQRTVHRHMLNDLLPQLGRLTDVVRTHDGGRSDRAGAGKMACEADVGQHDDHL